MDIRPQAEDGTRWDYWFVNDGILRVRVTPWPLVIPAIIGATLAVGAIWAYLLFQGQISDTTGVFWVMLLMGTPTGLTLGLPFCFRHRLMTFSEEE